MTSNDKLKKEQMKVIEDLYKIEVEVLEGGRLPVKAHMTDAGFDLYATQDVFLSHVSPPQKHPLNIKMKLPSGTYAEITTKSGLGSRGMIIYAGIIDQEYRGVPHVIFSNLNPQEPLKIKKGEKIAQMIMHPYGPSYFIEQVDKVESNTARGEGGFGSTGK